MFSLKSIYSQIQWLEHFGNHENMFSTGVVRANKCCSKCQGRRYNRDIFLIFFNMKICCVFSLFSLKLPHLGDSNEYTQYTIINIKQKITLNYPKHAEMRFLLGTQECVRNSHGKQAISV